MAPLDKQDGLNDPDAPNTVSVASGQSRSFKGGGRTGPVAVIGSGPSPLVAETRETDNESRDLNTGQSKDAKNR